MKRFSDTQRLNIRRYIDAAIKRQVKRYMRYYDGISGIENGIKGVLQFLKKAKIKEEISSGDFVTSSSFKTVKKISEAESVLNKSLAELQRGNTQEAYDKVILSSYPTVSALSETASKEVKLDLLRANHLIKGLSQAKASWRNIGEGILQ